MWPNLNSTKIRQHFVGLRRFFGIVSRSVVLFTTKFYHLIDKPRLVADLVAADAVSVDLVPMTASGYSHRRVLQHP